MACLPDNIFGTFFNEPDFSIWIFLVGIKIVMEDSWIWIRRAALLAVAWIVSAVFAESGVHQLDGVAVSVNIEMSTFLTISSYRRQVPPARRTG